jgi:hypothetical protein
VAYVDPDFKTKKELKAAVSSGAQLYPYSNGPFGITTEGELTIEGPHYPKPHAWYARVAVRSGVITKVLG